jgi:hypothetical protein
MFLRNADEFLSNCMTSYPRTSSTLVFSPASALEHDSTTCESVSYIRHVFPDITVR